MKYQLCYHDTNNISKGNRKFNENYKHLNVARLSYQFLSILFNQVIPFFSVTRLTLVTTLTYVT